MSTCCLIPSQKQAKQIWGDGGQNSSETLTERGHGEPSGLLEMFSILTWVVIMQAYTYVKIIKVCPSDKCSLLYGSCSSIKMLSTKEEKLIVGGLFPGDPCQGVWQERGKRVGFLGGVDFGKNVFSSAGRWRSP